MTPSPSARTSLPSRLLDRTSTFPWRSALPLVLLAFAACGPNEVPTDVKAPTPAPAVTAAALPTATAPATDAKPNADAAFDAVAAEFLKGALELDPVGATQLGDHTHDAVLPDPDVTGDAAKKAFYARIAKSLATIDSKALGKERAIDAEILRNQLAYGAFAIDELQETSKSPLFYTSLVGDALDPLVSRDFAPVDVRMKSLAGRLAEVPRIVAVAKKRLGTPAKVHTETAIEQNKGLLALTSNGFDDVLKTAPAQKEAVLAAAKKANAALKELDVFLRKDLLPRSTGDFRLGRATYEKKLRFVLEDDVASETLVAGAKALLTETQDAMARTALEVWPLVMKGPPPKAEDRAARNKMVKSVLDKLAETRPSDKTILADATKELERATAFVKEHDLVRLPEEPCKIIEMPEYRRGVAIAYCDSSGPLEAKQETFYAISPTPKDWPAARALSFYKEYNHAMLADLTVHEAMPGHYLQAMHANKFKSDVRAVFGNGAFEEGWAVYTEWLMAKYGFGGPKVRLMREKMVLRLAANAILDASVHAGTMTEKEALDLMMKEAFQEEGEAVGKWKRARLTSAQLTTYYYGFSEFAKLRAVVEKKPGFKERTYHDALLSHGAPSMKVTRSLFAD
ncbi:MAG: DUF885 domain-containing protein [Polyangiaceae bacterium]